MDSLLVLTMPGAAPCGDADAGGTALQEAIGMLRAGADVQLCPVAMPGDLDGALHRRGSRTVVVAGGDSDLHAVVSALHRRNELDEAVLGILPAGASDHFAAGAGIPKALADAAKVVLGGVQRRFDMIVDCRGDVVVNGAAVVGRSGRVPTGIGRLPGIGELAGVEALSGLMSSPLRLQVIADDHVVTDFDRPVLGVGVNNCPVAERGPQRCPEADPCDGYADVVVSFASGRLNRVRNALGSRHHMARADVLRLRARTVSVAGQWFSLATDGEDTGSEQRCTWTVMPERLRVVVPG